MNHPRIAALDVGTNSFHLVVARDTPNGFEVLTREKRNVRLGEGGGEMKTLSEEAMDRGIDALHHMKKVADAHKANIVAVATSAVREAANSHEFVARAQNETGITIEVISGVEEARLIHAGVTQALPISDATALLIDIGGGSTEVTVSDHEIETFVRSFKIGAVRLTNRFFSGGAIHPAAPTACRAYIRSLIEPSVREISANAHDIAVVTSGTAETLAKMCWLAERGELPRVMNGATFSATELRIITEQLIAAPNPQARLKVGGLDGNRADIIVAGALILDTLAEAFDITTLTYCDYALREGVLLEASRRAHPEFHGELRDIAIESAMRLAKRCSPDMTHNVHVAFLACKIFDGVSAFRSLPPRHRVYLEAAALMANCGLVISHSKHHLHSYYIIRNAELTGFNENEVEIIAQIARYHRKSEPKPSHNSYASLTASDRETVRLLAGILRVAIGLDRTHDSRCLNLKLEKNKETLRLHLYTDGTVDMSLNVYAAQERVDLLEQVLNSSIEIRDAGLELTTQVQSTTTD
jgi:exopolyphosphatase/guanosine-5'-triphosphate,3'-diphosphate pyrophosphatase